MQSVLDFISAHAYSLSMLGILLLDFIVELIPSLNGNNIVGLLLSALKGVKAPPAA